MITQVMPPAVGGNTLWAWARLIQGLRVRPWARLVRHLLWIYLGRLLRFRVPRPVTLPWTEEC